jgi:hypothetical protein
MGDDDKMGLIKVLLVGVCEYPALGCTPLPLCKNDLYAMRTALVKGLNVAPENILICGQTGNVTSSNLFSSIYAILSNATPEDTFIFYFSGHGGKGCLALSDGLIGLQDLIDTIESINTKNKIIILDSCHSGGFAVKGVPQIDITETVENFAGHGYAVMASCGSDEKSGFNEERQISLYTSFVCDALTSRFLIRKGKKSLETINEAIFRYAEVCNGKGKYNFQRPIFRANVGGTIFFDVEEYNPYRVAKIYKETDSYIIYAVEPVHNGMAKRLAVKVILRFQSSFEQIADIAIEIQKQALYFEVHQNEKVEARYRGKAANIIWCYFGYDEDDMVDGNFICRTTWVDDLQDKNWWYRSSESTVFVNGVHIEVYNSYNMIKGLRDNAIDKEELIRMTRAYSSKIITAAEQYIKIFREFANNTLGEDQLIDMVEPLNKEISLWFFKQSDLPIPPRELHDWAHAHTKIACTIHDFSLFYDRKNMTVWTAENKKWLMSDAIKKYEIELEELKSIERAL